MNIICYTVIWHTETHTHTHHHSQWWRRHKKVTYKSSFGSRLLHQARWTSQQDAFCPQEITKWKGEEGEAESTTIVHRKLRRSQQHLATTHPHARLLHSTHMLLHTKDTPELLTRTFSRRSIRTLACTTAVSILKSPVPFRTHTCTCMKRCCTSVWLRFGEADRGEEREEWRRVEHTTGCCWAREEGRGWRVGVGERVCALGGREIGRADNDEFMCV